MELKMVHDERNIEMYIFGSQPFNGTPFIQIKDICKIEKLKVTENLNLFYKKVINDSDRLKAANYQICMQPVKSL